MAKRQIARQCLLGCAGVLSWLLTGNSYALVNDSMITVTTPSAVTARRQTLVNYIWGSSGFPSAKMPTVHLNIPIPVANLPNLSRVDELDVTMDAGEFSLGYHFVPVVSNSRLIVFQGGHGTCSFDDKSSTETPGSEVEPGLQRAIAEMLREGYAVLTIFMPRETPSLCGVPSPDPHGYMFSNDKVTSGNVMKLFLEPTAVCLNYVKSSAKAKSDGFPIYQDFSMAGLSGGGWTTTVYAAIDPTISLSVPVAGSIPMYLRSGGSVGDQEQTDDPFYTLAGYPDLYVMGSYGSGRRQVQVLNRRDSCCFGQAQFIPQSGWDAAVRNYEQEVREDLKGLGAGNFRLEIDEASSGHMISWNALVNVLLAELAGDRRTVGATDASQAFVRGMNGTLWTYNTSNGWSDLGFSIVGVPAVLKGAVNAYDVFYRNSSNQLRHAYLSGGTWIEEAFSGVIITDPVAVSAQAGTYELVGLGIDYHPFYWSNAIPGSFTRMSNTAVYVGLPALVSGTAGVVDFFGRNAGDATGNTDRSLSQLHFLRSNGQDSAVATLIGGTTMRGFPSGVTNSGVLHAYVRDSNDNLSEASNPSGSWQWLSVSSAAGVSGTRLSGSPGASIIGNAIVVRARTQTTLAIFTHQGSWTFSSGGGAFVDSPAVTGSGAFARGVGSELQSFNGASWVSFGGEFD